jgi:hypothetical protein
LIRDVFYILEPEAAKRGVVLSTNGANAEFNVRADRVHLQQVLLNLAINGMDAMQSSARQARKLTVSAALQDCEVELSVADTGPGIPQDQLNAVFEPFFTTKQQGTGLGLSITRTIIELYRGKIWAENRADGGAAFRFTLPLAMQPFRAASLDSPSLTEDESGSKRGRSVPDEASSVGPNVRERRVRSSRPSAVKGASSSPLSPLRASIGASILHSPSDH